MKNTPEARLNVPMTLPEYSEFRKLAFDRNIKMTVIVRELIAKYVAEAKNEN